MNKGAAGERTVEGWGEGEVRGCRRSDLAATTIEAEISMGDRGGYLHGQRSFV